MPTWCFHPYWKPRSQGTCSPFTIPARLCICIYIPKRQFVCTHTQTQKIPRVFLRKEEKVSGDGGSRIRLIWRYSYIADCRKSKKKLPLIVKAGAEKYISFAPLRGSSAVLQPFVPASVLPNERNKDAIIVIHGLHAVRTGQKRDPDTTLSEIGTDQLWSVPQFVPGVSGRCFWQRTRCWQC